MLSLIRPQMVLLLILAGLGAAGCTQNLEQNEVFVKQSARLERAENDLSTVSRDLASLQKDIRQLRKEFDPVSRDVAQMAAKGPLAAPAALKDIEAKLARLESAMNSLGQGASAQGKDVAEAAPADAASPAADTADAAAPAKSGAKQGKVNLVATSPKSKKTTQSGAAQRNGAAARKSGKYYQVQDGDTLASVAAKNKITVSELRAANRLPAGATLTAGNSIFVPKTQ